MNPDFSKRNSPSEIALRMRSEDPKTSYQALMLASSIRDDVFDLTARRGMLMQALSMRSRLDDDMRDASERAIVISIRKIAPMCSPDEMSDLLVCCIKNKSPKGIKVCVESGADLFRPTREAKEIALKTPAGSARKEVIQLLDLAPYALMLSDMLPSEFKRLEAMYPALNDPLKSLPVVAHQMDPALKAEPRPVDLLRFCLLDILQIRGRGCLTRVLGRFNSTLCGPEAGQEIVKVLDGLAAEHANRFRMTMPWEMCLGMADVIIAAGEQAKPWIANRLAAEKDSTENSSVKYIMRELAGFWPWEKDDQAATKDRIRSLHDLGFSVSGPPGNHLHTPLMAACCEGHNEIVGLLIDLGADVDATHEGLSARDLAISGGHEDTAALIDSRRALLAIDQAIIQSTRPGMPGG